MKTKNNLPDSWCVKNDGSQLFKDTVIKYLNIFYHVGLEGRFQDFYGYYLNNNKNPCYSNPSTFGREISIKTFLLLSDYTPENFNEKYPELYDEIRECKIMEKNCNCQPEVKEKLIAISLEMARKLYANATEGMAAESMMTLLLENFTKNELEGKEGFAWGDCWPLHGYYFDNKNGFITGVCGTHLIKSNKNKHVFKSERQALSSLAFAQLTHILPKYNEGKAPNDNKMFEAPMLYSVQPINDRGTLGTWFVSGPHDKFFLFFKKEDAETSLRVNRELWEQYWMIEK